MNKRCSALVKMNMGRGFPRWKQCSRKAIVTRDKKHFCKIHDPIEVVKRMDKSLETQKKRYERERKLEYARLILKQKRERENEWR